MDAVLDIMATISPGFWFGVSTLLGDSAQDADGLLQLAQSHWEDCLRCCSDPTVLRRVLEAALTQGEPTKAALRSLASQLVDRRWAGRQAGLGCSSWEVLI
jgi:hypothetical protein